MGLRAGLAVISARPGDVASITFSRALRSDVSSAARASRVAPSLLHEASDAELSKLADSDHHEGLVVVSARPRRWSTPNEIADRLVARGGAAIALDRVRNPYNVGAILRTAAFFGIDAAILGAIAPHPALAPLAVRVAEGGCEHLMLARTTDLADSISRLKSRGVRVVGAAGEARSSVFDEAFARPCVVVVGNEREGLHPRVRAQCDALISIRGSGAVESLNVSAAAAVLIAAIAKRAS